jgi:hypothetical protein
MLVFIVFRSEADGVEHKPELLVSLGLNRRDETERSLIIFAFGVRLRENTNRLVPAPDVVRPQRYLSV